MKLIRISFIYCFLILSFNSFAQRTIVLTDSIKEFVFQLDYFSILEDTSGEFTIQDIVRSDIQKKFRINNKPAAFNENLNSAYWIKFSIINKSSINHNYCLESYSPHTEYLNVYYERNKNWIKKSGGQSIYFYDRELINKNLVFDLPVDTTKAATYYIRVKSENYCGFDFRIKPLNYFINYNTNEYFFLGFYYGILIIMALYNLLLYFSIKENVYIYYVLYVCSGILSTLTEDCLGYQYVWFKYPELNTPIGHHIAPLLLLITFVLYSRKFLNIKSLIPKMDFAIQLSVLIFLGYYILHLTILPESFYFRSIYLIPFIMVYISSISIFYNGYKPARFFIIGYTIIFLSIVIIQLRANGTIKGNLLTVYSLNYGLVLEVAVLSFAMADRIRFIKKEKEDALYEKNKAQQSIIEQFKINDELKDRVNRELEEKVALRTVELHEKNKALEEANSKLKELTEKANLMSLKLDMDNWNLQKSIKESIKDRMSGKEVSYDEFNRIFSDESTCLRYLDELKWNTSYQCRKCGNEKYINSVKIFTRKCSKCGYPESVTANTLFHGLRFPLNKAFYMTYLIHKESRITLDELSILLDLRRNTCWSFKKKVTTLIKQKNRKKIETWEDLIMLS